MGALVNAHRFEGSAGGGGGGGIDKLITFEIFAGISA